MWKPLENPFNTSITGVFWEVGDSKTNTWKPRITPRTTPAICYLTPTLQRSVDSLDASWSGPVSPVAVLGVKSPTQQQHQVAVQRNCVIWCTWGSPRICFTCSSCQRFEMHVIQILRLKHTTRKKQEVSFCVSKLGTNIALFQTIEPFWPPKELFDPLSPHHLRKSFRCWVADQLKRCTRFGFTSEDGWNMLYVETLKNQTCINGTFAVFNRYQLVNYPHFVSSKMSLKSIHPHLHKPSWQLGVLLPPFPFLSLPGIGKGRGISNIAGFVCRFTVLGGAFFSNMANVMVF